MPHNYFALLGRLRAGADDIPVVEYGRVREGGKDYPLVSLETPGKKRLLLTAGFHGEEPAGPLTLARHLKKIVAHAEKHGVGLTIFPCINPSGFELGTRYNASGEKPNNDFLRYELTPGEWVGELPPGHSEFLRWKLYDGGPKETRLVRQEIARRPPPHAALDLHQDHYCPGVFTYAYVFGPSEAYQPLVSAASLHMEIGRSRAVDEVNHTDADGLIRYHDGSVTDLCFRRGTHYTAALETTTASPMPSCEKTNLVWIKGFIELAACAPEPAEPS